MREEILLMFRMTQQPMGNHSRASMVGRHNSGLGMGKEGAEPRWERAQRGGERKGSPYNRQLPSCKTDQP